MSAPKELDSIIGNARAVSALKIAVKAAKIEQRLPGHILLYGPPGIGKTTLAAAVGAQFNGNFIRIHGTEITKKTINDFLRSLLMMEDGDTLFVDEVHALPKEAMVSLLEALEEGQISIMGTAENGQPSPVTIKISPILIIAATTKPNALIEPFKMRFERRIQLEIYTEQELCQILSYEERAIRLAFTENDLMEIARRSRGRARIALQFFNVVCDHIMASHISVSEGITEAFQEMGIGWHGDTKEDRLYIQSLTGPLKGRPAGLDSISSVSGLTKQDIENSIEPYLIGLGLLEMSRSGRKINLESPLLQELKNG